MANPHEKYTKEILESAVRQNHSVAGVLRTLGLRPSGGMHSHLALRTSRAAWFRGYRQRKKGPVAEQAYARGLGPRARKGLRVRLPPGPVD